MKEAIETALQEHQRKTGIRDLRQHCTCGWKSEPAGDGFIQHQAERVHGQLWPAAADAIERASKALCAFEFPEVSPSYAWGVQFEDGQNHYREMVGTVIQALTNQAGQS